MVTDYAAWGSAHWYQFMVQDGAIDDFRSSGGTDLAAFLLQDLQGALFFHPVLSAVIGTLGGAVGGGITLGPLALWRQLRRPVATRV